MLKQTFTVNSASSATFGQAASTRSYFGTLIRMEYDPTTTVANANSSMVVRVRRNTTVGNVLARSSSSLAATARAYNIRGAAIGSTLLGTSGLNCEIPLAGDTLKIIREGSSTGNLQGASVSLFIKGDHAH